METNHPNNNFLQNDNSFLNDGLNSETREIEDYNREFVYENAEGLTGMSYINYLRSYDDML